MSRLATRLGVRYASRASPSRGTGSIEVLDIQASDFVTIGLLVALEGLLSADNALVMAVMVLGLPRSQHKKALQYGLVGAIRVARHRDAARGLPDSSRVGEAGRRPLPSYADVSRTSSATTRARTGRPRRRRRPMLGLSALLGDDRPRRSSSTSRFRLTRSSSRSRCHRKMWVVITGGVLGIVAHAAGGRTADRAGAEAIRRWSMPRSSSSRGWASSWRSSSLHAAGYVEFEVPRSISLGLIIVIFVDGVHLRARQRDPVEHVHDSMEEKATDLLTDDRQA